MNTNKEDLNRIITECSETIRTDPNDAKAYAYRGIAYLNTGDYAHAIADLNEAMRILQKGIMTAPLRISPRRLSLSQA